MLLLPICLFLLGADPMHPTVAPPTAAHPALAPEHARLAAMVGTWDVQLTSWQKPGESPLKSRGFAVIEPLFGGLFIQERLEGLIGEAPYVMLSWTGFDTTSRSFQATHIATTASSLATDSGSFDERQGALVLEGDHGPAGGRLRRVITQPSPDSLLVECYELPTTGPPWRTSEVRYARRKP